MGSKAAQVGEVQIGCRCGELVAGGRLGAHQNRSAAGILRADHVNIGIAHEPNILPRGRAVYRLPYRQDLTGKVTAVVTVRPLNGSQAGAFAPPMKPRTRKFRVRL